MRSGVEGTREEVEVLGEGWRDEAVGERRREFEGVVVEVEIVVLRAMLVVSAEGGGGRFVGKEADNMLARQRKHSPVPK